MCKKEEVDHTGCVGSCNKNAMLTVISSVHVCFIDRTHRAVASTTAARSASEPNVDEDWLVGTNVGVTQKVQLVFINISPVWALYCFNQLQRRFFSNFCDNIIQVHMERMEQNLCDLNGAM